MGALGHGRFDAGAKMTDKRRVNEVYSYADEKLCINYFLPQKLLKSLEITLLSAKYRGFEWLSRSKTIDGERVLFDILFKNGVKCQNYLPAVQSYELQV